MNAKWCFICFVILMSCTEISGKKKKSKLRSNKKHFNLRKNRLQICKLESATSLITERTCRLPLSTCTERVQLEEEDGSVAYRLSFCEIKGNVLNVDKFAVSCSIYDVHNCVTLIHLFRVHHGNVLTAYCITSN